MATPLPPVLHRRITIGGIEIFYREAGPEDAPVVLLPHGYPCSSFQFRHLMPALGDRWRMIAPDYPGFGYSGTPGFDEFDYSFDGYAELLDRLAVSLGVSRYVLYLHDYGSQIGLRLAIQRPERIAGLIIQNGDIYEDELGPKYKGLKEYWSNPTPEARKKLEAAVSEEGFRDEFIGEVADHLVGRISPDLWKLSWPLMDHPIRREIAVRLMEGLRDNLEWPQDGFMPESAARAYLRDLPDAEIHLLDGGHWALETNLDEIVPRVRAFLQRVYGDPPN